MNTVTDSWSTIQALVAWTPLSEVPLRTRHVADNLYAVEASQYYLLTSTSNERFESDPRAPLVTLAYWAASEGSARRATLWELGADDGATASLPLELALSGKTLAHDDLVKQAKAQGMVPFEHASYPLPLDGRLLHKQVDIGRVSYCFRTPENTSDLPYAVEIRLRDRPRTAEQGPVHATRPRRFAVARTIPQVLPRPRE